MGERGSSRLKTYEVHLVHGLGHLGRLMLLEGRLVAARLLILLLSREGEWIRDTSGCSASLCLGCLRARWDVAASASRTKLLHLRRVNRLIGRVPGIHVWRIDNF